MEGKKREFDDALNSFDSQSTCSAGNSEDSLVKFSDLNIISHSSSKRKIAIS